MLIIQRLRNRPQTFDEIASYLAEQSKFLQLDLNISLRTFQRDINEIRSIYKINIEFDKGRKSYVIDFAGNDAFQQRILESVHTIHVLQHSEQYGQYLHLELRRPQGTEHLNGLLHAIQNRRQVIFNYTKYWELDLSTRQVAPLLLREFRSRWYLVAEDQKDHKIKIFGIDRISDLEIIRTKFKNPENFDHSTYFNHCYGITKPENETPVNIELSFKPQYGKYVKSLPIHDSQQIIRDDKHELVISLYVYITYELVMEIMSHGDMVKVLSPKKLVSRIEHEMDNTSKQLSLIHI